VKSEHKIQSAEECIFEQFGHHRTIILKYSFRQNWCKNGPWRPSFCWTYYEKAGCFPETGAASFRSISNLMAFTSWLMAEGGASPPRSHFNASRPSTSRPDGKQMLKRILELPQFVRCLPEA
jgi:hypothetical protein